MSALTGCTASIGARLCRQFRPMSFANEIQSVRWTTPWWKITYRQHYFKFDLKKTLQRESVQTLMKTAPGRRTIMRRLLKREVFLGWGHPERKPDQRLNRDK